MEPLARRWILHMLHSRGKEIAAPRALERDRALDVRDLLLEHVAASAATAALMQRGVLDHELRQLCLWLRHGVRRDAAQEVSRGLLLFPLAFVSAAVCLRRREVGGDATEER